MIKIWQAFSCNNSGASRLVARFADAASAKATGDELRKLLAELEERRSSGVQALSTIYGFTWRDNGAGDDGDGPHVIVDETTMIVHHDYCLGIGPGVPAYLQEKGATQIDKETWTDVHISVLFRMSPDPRLDEELAALFAQPIDAERMVQTLEAPWVREHTRGKVAFYRDAGIVGLFFPIDARDFAPLRAWFAERTIEPIVRIEAYADQDLFNALAAARCTACAATLEYLDPRLHDIETPQLVCRPCGGLYDLAAFTEPR